MERCKPLPLYVMISLSIQTAKKMPTFFSASVENWDHASTTFSFLFTVNITDFVLLFLFAVIQFLIAQEMKEVMKQPPHSIITVQQHIQSSLKEKVLLSISFPVSWSKEQHRSKVVEHSKSRCTIRPLLSTLKSVVTTRRTHQYQSEKIAEGK